MISAHDRLIRYLYLVTLVFLVLSGFAQMPIFKRYYIADIPGLAWLAQFYITHAMHYGFGALFIALVFYTTADHLLDRKKDRQITPWGWSRAVIVFFLILSGGLLVYKNLTGTPFSPLTVSILDVMHLGLCMLLLILNAYTTLKKRPGVIHPIEEMVMKVQSSR